MQTTRPARPLPALVLACALACGAVAPAAAEPTVSGDRGTDMAVDLVLMRPLGIVATVVGTVGFVVALPFTLPTGTTGDTAREWVAAPFEYTFNRPLGQFDACGSGPERHRCGY